MRYRILKEDDGAFGLYDDVLDLKIGHYYKSRKFVEQIVWIYIKDMEITAPAAYGFAADFLGE